MGKMTNGVRCGRKSIQYSAAVRLHANVQAALLVLLVKRRRFCFLLGFFLGAWLFTSFSKELFVFTTMFYLFFTSPFSRLCFINISTPPTVCSSAFPLCSIRPYVLAAQKKKESLAPLSCEMLLQNKVLPPFQIVSFFSIKKGHAKKNTCAAVHRCSGREQQQRVHDYYFNGRVDDRRCLG